MPSTTPARPTTPTVVRVTYYGPTNVLGSRFRVTPLRGDMRGNARPRSVDFDYSANNAREAAVLAYYGGPDAPVRVEYGGEDARHTYYVVSAR